MKLFVNPLILLALLATPLASTAFEALPTNDEEYLCYSQAMIGYDSVINSRLGVPAEHALDLAVLNNNKRLSSSQKVYSGALLKTILDAYLWSDDPHSYAIKVFYRCAQEDTKLKSAQNDWITTD